MTANTAEMGLGRKDLTPAAHELIKPLEVLSMNRDADRFLAAQKVAQDEVIALFAFQYGAMFRAETQEQTSLHTKQVKGIDRKIPVAIWIEDPSDITDRDFVDLDRVDPSCHEMFSNPSLFAHLTQGTCHIRFPVRDDATFNDVPLHSGVTSHDESGPWFQVFYMGENQRSAQSFIEHVYDQGVKIAAITSLNLHKQPFPGNHSEAEDLCIKRNIPTLILDKKSKIVQRVGSYPIFQIDTEGATLLREGNIHPQFLEALGWQYDSAKGVETEYDDVSALQLKLFEIIAKTCPSLLNYAISMAASE